MATVMKANGKGYEERQEALSSDADFILTSYNNWSATYKDGAWLYDILTERKWSALVFDEAHRLRGHQSKATKHVIKTRLVKSPNRDTPLWLLTGTPMVRDGSDFFIYFHLYDKKRYGSYWKFVKDRCVTTETPWGVDVGNIRKSYTKEFQEELAQFTLRRTVKDIPQLQNLEYQEHEYFVTMPPSVVAMIKKAKKEYVLEHPDLARTKLLEGSGALYVAQRQIATNPPTKVNPKLDWLKDFLQDKKGKIVVYVWFKASAATIESGIRSLGRRVMVATGDVSPSARSDVVSEWKSSEDGILVATIPALKEGISLVEANEVVFLEHSELPADHEQCIKRLCRRGQSKVVQVHHVHAKATVDMAIRSVLDNRNSGIQGALTKWVSTEDDETWFT